MKIAIMQPYVFPYIGYFQLIQAVDVFVFYDDVNFIKKGYINKNALLINGSRNSFTISCKEVSQNKLIKDTLLFFEEKSRIKFLKTIKQAYQNSPFFGEIYPRLERFILNDTSNTISEFAITSVLFVAEYLDIKKKWVLSSKSHWESKDLKKEQRLIHIAKAEGATTYINPIGGIDLYDKNDFKDHNMTLHFIKSKPVAYKQFSNDFVPWLSILDVLMFNSKDQIRMMINAYDFV